MLLLTYNVLASSYIRPKYYPSSPPEALGDDLRMPLLVERIVALDADVLCLQEVESNSLEALRRALPHHACQFLPKGQGKPDGCATFVRSSEGLEWREIRFADSGPANRRPSGHVALIAEMTLDGRRLTIANTHLKWDPPAVRGSERWGYRQATLLLGELQHSDKVLCGDLNVVPGDEILALIAAAGLLDGFRDEPRPSAVTNGKAQRIDYVFHSSSLRARARAGRPLSNKTVMPSLQEPSDHLPVVVELDWATSSSQK